MRLFIALDLDDASRSAIGEEQKRLQGVLRDSRSSIKWVRPDHMHLTMVFLGEVDEGRAAPIVDDLRLGLGHTPFDMVFRDIGVFPPRGAPNVLWLGVGSGAESAIALQRTLSERVASHGLALETRPFHPHLTLARWRESRSADRQAVMTAAHRAVTTLHVDHATLYQSRLSPGGPTYTVLARANLASTRAAARGAGDAEVQS